MQISKVIKTDLDEDSWIIIYEFPDHTIVLEGIRRDPLERTNFLTQRIRFTREATNKLIPVLLEWINR